MSVVPRCRDCLGTIFTGRLACSAKSPGLFSTCVRLTWVELQDRRAREQALCAFLGVHGQGRRCGRLELAGCDIPAIHFSQGLQVSQDIPKACTEHVPRVVVNVPGQIRSDRHVKFEAGAGC